MTLDRNEGTIAVNGTLTLTATTVPEDAEVTWTSSNDSIASVSDGVVTGEASGSATITATITVDGQTASATCAITVIEPSVELDKSSDSVVVNGTTTLTATTVPADAEVTWTSSDDTVAEVTDGTVTGVATGTATITATITVDEVDYTDTCAIEVVAEV